MVSGSIQSSNDRGSADVAIPLKGSKADGTLRMEAYKDADEWKFTTLQVDVPGHPTIDLLGGSPAPPANTVPFPETLPDVEPLPELPEDAPPGGSTDEPAEPERQDDIEL